jgi:hypothetical protein
VVWFGGQLQTSNHRSQVQVKERYPSQIPPHIKFFFAAGVLSTQHADEHPSSRLRVTLYSSGEKKPDGFRRQTLSELTRCSVYPVDKSPVAPYRLRVRQSCNADECAAFCLGETGEIGCCNDWRCQCPCGIEYVSSSFVGLLD